MSPAMQTFELRQYTLQPGARDGFVALFDREFVEPQEAGGSAIIGQFRDLDDPNRFVWIRGHADMEQRGRSMHAFYDGEQWKAHRGAANDAITDSDNVLLLKPAWPGSGFAHDGVRAAMGSMAPVSGVVRATICHFDGFASARFVDTVRGLVPAMETAGGKFLAALVSEHGENTFPRHPVREGENVLMWFSLFADEASERRAAQNWSLPQEMAAPLTRPMERLRLQPTPRSKLHA